MRGLLVHAGEEEGGMIEVLVLVTLTRRRPIVSIGGKGGGDFLSMQERRGWITSTWKPWQLITPIVKPGRASKKPTEQLLLL